MKRKWRHRVLCVLLALGSTAAAWSLSDVSFFRILNLKAYDAHFVIRSLLQGPPIIPNIVLLVEDQKTFDTFSEPRLFWHKHYADAIRAASDAGAKVIGLDHAFGIPVDKWEPDYDRLIGESLSASAAPVIYGYVTELNSNATSQSMPINMIAAGLGLGAFANLTADADDFVRRQELIEGPSKNPSDPPPARSFALRIAEKYLDVDAEVRDGRLLLAKQELPISADRTLAINYAGPPGTFPRYSLADFEAAARAGDQTKLRNLVGGKIVLIGIDFADEDRKATPFYTLFGGPKWTTAGVEIHANTIRTLLEHLYLVPVPEWVLLLALILATSITVWIATTLIASRAAVFVLLEVIVILAATHLVFEGGFILSTSEVLLATSLCLIGSVVYRFGTEEKGRQSFPPGRFYVRQQATSDIAGRNSGHCTFGKTPGGHHPVHRYPRVHRLHGRRL